MIDKNPAGQYPAIDKSAYVDKSARIIGNVKIGKNVFIGPLAVVRADEPGSSIEIGDDCNIQDHVVIHAFSLSKVVVGNNSSLSHGSIVHGPCIIGRGCFIGFGCVVTDAVLGDNIATGHLSLIEKKTIKGRKQSDALAMRVVKANKLLAAGYKKL